MAPKKILVLLFIAFLFSLILISLNYVKNLNKPNPENPQPTVKIGDLTIPVEVVEAPEEKARGLSGRSSLNENMGMLFVFSPKEKASFWMIDMNFPLDIIWITDEKIIGIEKNVPAPEKGTQNDKLPLYYSPSEIDHVLEVNSGFSDSHNLKPGDAVELNI